ncbi:hypothetical protein D3C81_681630 [compost metagenome]
MLHDHQVGRDHVVRQAGLQVLPQGGTQVAFVFDLIVGYHVAAQLFACGLIDSDHGGLTHLRVRLHMLFDLAQFNAETAHLHLMVYAATVGNFTLLVEVTQITCAVQPPPADFIEGVGDEAFSRQRRTLVVTTRQAPVTANVQFTGYANRRRRQTVVQRTHDPPRQCTANRHTAVCRRGMGQARAVIGGGNHRGFSRPVGVKQPYCRRAICQPGLQAIEGHGFAADMDLLQLAIGLRLAAIEGQQAPIGGRQVGDGHPVPNDLLAEGVGIPELLIAHHDASPPRQWREELLDEAVETERRELQHAVFG